MLPIFINIGSGSRLMGVREFGQFSGASAGHNDYVIFNMDKSPLAEGAPAPSGNFETASADTSIMLQDGTVEIIFAISPYGYYPLNPEIWRVLKPQGIVVVVGGKSNKYAKTPKTRIVEGPDASFERLDFFPPVIKDMLIRVGSGKTDGETMLDMTGFTYVAYMKTDSPPG